MRRDHPLSGVSRRILLQRAVDVTDHAARRTALVLAPHPDDETIGCGATIARKRAVGTDVAVWIATDGRGSARGSDVTSTVTAREHETRGACRALGVDASAITFFGVEDGEVEREQEHVEDALVAELGTGQFDEVYVPSPDDAHADHRALFAAAVRAVARAGTPTDVLAYPVWFWSKHTWIARSGTRLTRMAHYRAGPLAAAGRLRPVTIRTDEFLAPKRDALQHYEDELGGLQLDTERWFLADRELFFRIPR